MDLRNPNTEFKSLSYDSRVHFFQRFNLFLRFSKRLPLACNNRFMFTSSKTLFFCVQLLPFFRMVQFSYTKKAIFGSILRLQITLQMPYPVLNFRLSLGLKFYRIFTSMPCRAGRFFHGYVLVYQFFFLYTFFASTTMVFWKISNQVIESCPISSDFSR